MAEIVTQFVLNCVSGNIIAASLCDVALNISSPDCRHSADKEGLQVRSMLSFSRSIGSATTNLRAPTRGRFEVLV